MSFDQHYTNEELSAELVSVVDKILSISSYDLVIEPSAGSGAFSDILRRMNDNVIAYDIEPKNEFVVAKDFLTYNGDSSSNILTIGNPPYGYRAQGAISFFNKAAEFSSVIAMILPKSFRKEYIINQLNNYFHLILDIDVPQGSFHSKTNCRTCFQIWNRMLNKRKPNTDKIIIDDFLIVSQGKQFNINDADWAIRRTGWTNVGEVIQPDLALPITQYIFLAATGISKQLLFDRLISLDLNCSDNTSMVNTFSSRELMKIYSVKYPVANTILMVSSL